MTAAELEMRVVALERKVEALMNDRASPANHDWIFEMWGYFAGDKEFKKAMSLGRKWRKKEDRRRLEEKGN